LKNRRFFILWIVDRKTANAVRYFIVFDQLGFSGFEKIEVKVYGGKIKFKF